MDMKEMVAKVKKGEPLYGKSELTPYMQGVAARNSRYSQLFIHVIPWFNIVNHDQVRSYCHHCYVSCLDSKCLRECSAWRRHGQVLPAGREGA